MGIECLLLPVLIGFIALLCASVGLGGASGYLAVMALFGLAPEVLRPAGLKMIFGIQEPLRFIFHSI